MKRIRKVLWSAAIGLLGTGVGVLAVMMIWGMATHIRSGEATYPINSPEVLVLIGVSIAASLIIGIVDYFGLLQIKEGGFNETHEKSG